jgi:hypothetical protein
VTASVFTIAFAAAIALRSAGNATAGVGEGLLSRHVACA